MHALYEEMLQMDQFQMIGCYTYAAWEMQYRAALPGSGVGGLVSQNGEEIL